MEKEEPFRKHEVDARDLDPRIIGEKIYRNPIDICYDIDDVILRVAANNRLISMEILKIMNNILTLNDSIRSLFYVKEKNKDVNVNPNDLIALAKIIKTLLENEEFWKLHPDSVFKEENNNSERKYNPAMAVEDKESLKKVLSDFVKLLNYFALENFSPGRKKH